MLNNPLFSTASGQRSFEYRAMSLLKELQTALKLSESVTTFCCSEQATLQNVPHQQVTEQYVLQILTAH